MHSVQVISGKHDGLADVAAGGFAYSFLHQGPPDESRRVPVEDVLVDVLRVVVHLLRRRLLILKLRALMLAHLRIAQALLSELTGEGPHAEGHQERWFRPNSVFEAEVGRG